MPRCMGCKKSLFKCSCAEVEALRSAVEAGVLDLHNELSDIRRAAEAIRDRVDEDGLHR